MRLSPRSKQAIFYISAITAIAVALLEFWPTTPKELTPQEQALTLLGSEGLASIDGAEGGVTGTSAAVGAGTDTGTDESVWRPSQAEIIVRSLTNSQHDVSTDLTAQETVYLTGYVLGAGAATIAFFGEREQHITATLSGNESQLFEMVLFSASQTEVISLISGEPYRLPTTGLYELRIVFRSHIETIQALEAEAKLAVPQAYTIALELK